MSGLRRAWWAGLCAAVLGGCSGEPEQPQQRFVEAPPESIEYGAPIELRWERRWPGLGRPRAWDPRDWAPLDVELRDRRIVHVDDFVTVEEVTLRLRAWSLGEQQLSLPFEVLDADTGIWEAAEPLTWATTVTTALPRADAGLLEAPEALPLARPWSLRRALAVAVGLLLAGVFWLSGRLRPTTARATAHRATAPDPWEQLRALETAPQETAWQRQAVLEGARELLRDLVPGRAWAGQELIARLEARCALSVWDRGAATEVVQAAEASHFGGLAPTTAELQQELDALAEVMRAWERAAEEARA